jgi:hypothetical protein
MSGGLAVVLLLAVFAAPMLVIVACVLRNERWPAPRAHHEHHCPRCACSYESASTLARHWTHMHTDEHVFRIERDGGPRRGAA